MSLTSLSTHVLSPCDANSIASSNVSQPVRRQLSPRNVPPPKLCKTRYHFLLTDGPITNEQLIRLLPTVLYTTLTKNLFDSRRNYNVIISLFVQLSSQALCQIHSYMRTWTKNRLSLENLLVIRSRSWTCLFSFSAKIWQQSSKHTRFRLPQCSHG